MFKKIFKTLSFTFFTIFIISSTIFSDVYPSIAAQINSESNEDTMGIVIDESSDYIDGSETSAFPDLGDDQAFPFIPGFGKNSGKD